MSAPDTAYKRLWKEIARLTNPQQADCLRLQFSRWQAADRRRAAIEKQRRFINDLQKRFDAAEDTQDKTYAERLQIRIREAQEHLDKLEQEQALERSDPNVNAFLTQCGLAERTA